MFLGEMFLCTCTYQYIQVHISMYWYVPYIDCCTNLYHPVPSCKYSTCVNHVLTCTVLYSLVPIRNILYWLVPSCTETGKIMYWFVQSSTVLYRSWKSCTDLYRPPLIRLGRILLLSCTVLYWLVPNGGNPALSCTGLYQSGKSCTCLYRLVLVRPGTYRDVPIHNTLKCGSRM